MGIQHDLNVVRNCRKSLLHLTMLASIVAAAAATSTIEPTLTTSSSSSLPSTPSLEKGIPVAPPSLTPTTETVNDNNGQLVTKNRPAIPYCDESDERTIGRRLLYVTTLDGRLTALDITKSGKVRWSIPTGPGPLISSSIHRLELTNNGQFVRMIPSLSGGIYKFDGESIDPIPITTDNLLSSSAKFSDDLVISGGKETRTYGVSARTGQLLYECSMNGCVNSTDAEFQNRNATKTVEQDDDVSVEDEENLKKDDINGNGYVREHDPLIDDVIVVRRQTQTVRAVETRTGVERWNFSVGQHELDLIRPAECHDRKFSNLEMAILDLDIKVIVPEGVICAFSKLEPSVMLWKYKFDHPIVSAWKIGSADTLESIDMFGSAQWLWNQDDNIFEMPLPNINPSLYVGMYDRQLYIQESIHLRKEILDQSHLYTQLTTETRLPKIPWRPIAASSNSLIIYQHSDEQRIETGGSYNSKEIQGNELVPYDDENFALSAQSVLNASEYVNGNGFYLYTSDELENNNTEDDMCDTTSKKELPAIDDKKIDNTSSNNHTIDDDLGFSLDDIDAPIKVVILSIWFWWKELAIVAFTSALLLNILISQRNRGERQIVVIERHIPVPSGIEATESSTAALLGPTTNTTHTNTNSKSSGNVHRSLSESTSNSSEHFTSRFQSDFDLQRCLGRGGFGVVFEAKNKLDDCSYAIKRITLPNKEESRMRVMREVKTLANCEHQNIVRYFQSWVEKPPPGWQEVEDNKWLANEMSTSIQIDTPSETHSTFPQYFEGNNIDKKKQLQTWMESMASTACSSDHKCFSNGNYNDDEDEDEDSCVIFRSESDSLAMRDRHQYEDEDSDSCVIFRSESQSMAMKLEDDNTSTESDITNRTKFNKNGIKKKSHNDAISIDIQTNSIDLNVHRGRRNIDYSQLSDSFQIEFVRSVDGDEPTPVEEEEEEEEDSTNSNKTKEVFNKKRRPQDLALDISIGENNNRMPVKPQQNKVYLYIQMQLCRKECLRDWLRDNKREDRQDFIASIFHQIVDAVDYVHFKGLIHRDLKPSNIFFSQEGQIKIGDFGLVTDMADIPNMITKCGDNTGLPSCARHTQQVGTHLYMSPEQLRGLPYDYKVDIYSLGLIFFELLVYFGTEMERIKTLRSLRDGIYPKDFPTQHPKEYELLKKMLSSKPEERPATNELKLQLNEILKLPDLPGDSEAAALAAAARRLSRSRTFSSCE
ncbi:eukaryotic translation initiation factor 2-alpha kinase [Lucilia cuprina]|uniref:eukaryotic translation initiation factor 2-alpha kinase n=1 Tax=Lucilia cuprina TaxID=7375 RepID=UPI001F06A2B3|nr:eukaryotic translation initiation factor 2-alpha kinase [Lucilia cuprina]XP_023302860.2 eukaryotic translation initiation factor 2-alpha kinase [Lucilia cuprina]XP_046804106.1 eukaryotic translation initiation factor 2-alpha kinase [Lucilia cuprina]XP_046804108.1 eukaryotic translation initiation factor 2-alpha kinase [Lucilia cuprina]